MLIKKYKYKNRKLVHLFICANIFRKKKIFRTICLKEIAKIFLMKVTTFFLIIFPMYFLLLKFPIIFLLKELK